MSETSWSIIAQNLPGHARNPIHTDAGAISVDGEVVTSLEHEAIVALPKVS